MRIKCDKCRYKGRCRFQYDEKYPGYLRYIRAETCKRFEENTIREGKNESKN